MYKVNLFYHKYTVRPHTQDVHKTPNPVHRTKPCPVYEASLPRTMEPCELEPRIPDILSGKLVILASMQILVILLRTFYKIFN